MEDLKEIRTALVYLAAENRELMLSNYEKSALNNELMERVNRLEEELQYKKSHDGIKRLILRRETNK